MVIHSPKTEHHAGGESRVIPLFPELRPYLEEVWEQAEPGTEFVITRYRQKNVNLRTQLQKIIKRAGLKPWPKLFQNLRASRATELVNSFPGHVAAAWLGHCEAIAEKHYWQVTDDHFEQAISAAQNPAQQAHGMGRKVSHGKNGDFPNPLKSEDLRNIASTRDIVKKCPVGDTGFEPVASTM